MATSSDGGLVIKVVEQGAKPVDRLAVALGNASLLGVGYLILGEVRTAVTAVLVTAVLVTGWVFAPAWWVGALLVVWWLVGIVHGWLSATGAPWRATSVPQRLLALVITVPLLVGFGVVHYQTHELQQDVAGSQAAGDCGPVLAAEGRITAPEQVVDALAVRNLHRDSEVCHQLGGVALDLNNGLQANLTALASSYATMTAALSKPGNDATVGTTLDGFLGRLPLKEDPYDTVIITDWMRKQKADSAVLDRATKTAEAVGQTAVANCGDRLLDGGKLTDAQKMYQRLVNRPGTDPLADRAKKGIAKATEQLELIKVQNLFGDRGTIAYCGTPARYSGAPAPHKGLNRTNLIDLSGIGIDSIVPDAWLTTDPSKTVYVVCTDTKQNGPATRTCPYHSISNPTLGADVTFHKVAVPVKVYELRTGRLIINRELAINGTSCPKNFTEVSSTGYPPSDTLVDPSPTDIQSTFRPLITR